jgi:hypothetical protein
VNPDLLVIDSAPFVDARQITCQIERHGFGTESGRHRPGRQPGHSSGPKSGFFQQFPPCNDSPVGHRFTWNIPDQPGRQFNGRPADRNPILLHENQFPIVGHRHDRHGTAGYHPLGIFPAPLPDKSNVFAGTENPATRFGR